jgi:uncharacterized membrane protein YeaQ/YmgE (transglycosylase-associated protein family)
MKFAFIAKHRGIWPAGWLCRALGVSRSGFYAWLTRPCSPRRRSDEELGAKVHASFLGSDRTYGARRVWHDVQPQGFILTAILGIVGAFVASFLGQLLGWYRPGEGAGLIGAVVGAIIVLFVYGYFAGRKTA